MESLKGNLLGKVITQLTCMCVFGMSGPRSAWQMNGNRRPTPTPGVLRQETPWGPCLRPLLKH